MRTRARRRGRGITWVCVLAAACGSDTVVDPTPPELTLDGAPAYTREGTLALGGTTERSAVVRVSGGAAAAEAEAGADGRFVVQVPLRPNAENVLVVTAEVGRRPPSAPEEVRVTHDDQPPVLTFVSPDPSDPLAGLGEDGAVRVSFSDAGPAGLDASTLRLEARQTLIGLLQSDGQRLADVGAGADLLAGVTASASLVVVPLRGRYSVPAGTRFRAQLADRAGNAAVDSATLGVAEPGRGVVVLASEASPGAEHRVPLGLVNLEPLRAVSFRVRFDPAVLTVESVAGAGRIAFPVHHDAAVNGASGEVGVVVLDLGGGGIAMGQDVALELVTTVSAAAAAGTQSTIFIVPGEATDDQGRTLSLLGSNGDVRIR